MCGMHETILDSYFCCEHETEALGTSLQLPLSDQASGSADVHARQTGFAKWTKGKSICGDVENE